VAAVGPATSSVSAVSVSASAPRYRDVALGGSLAAQFTHRADGSTLVRSTEALGP
jgi:hypothetical protein